MALQIIGYTADNKCVPERQYVVMYAKSKSLYVIKNMIIEYKRIHNLQTETCGNTAPNPRCETDTANQTIRK